MYEYIARAPFRRETVHGQQVVTKGEAIRLSSSKAAQLVTAGFLVEKHVCLDLFEQFEARVRLLMDHLGHSRHRAEVEAIGLVKSCLARHLALQTENPPSPEFLEEVARFNDAATGKNPVIKEKSEKGVGEWAGYTCNIGAGCSHGCFYCYAEKMAARFNRVHSPEEWREESLRKVSTRNCQKYDSAIMFPTTHDLSMKYLPAYRCHLYNLLDAGNTVLIVSKPRLESISAICQEFTWCRDRIIFRFTIGSLSNEEMSIWEPGAPPLAERLTCLTHAFEHGFKTSISAEPILGDREDAERLYYAVEPFTTEEIWFGKMNYIGRFCESPNRELADRAKRLITSQNDEEILRFVAALNGRHKVKWKDSIQEVINEHNNKGCQLGQGE